MISYDGYVRELTPKERLANEVNACQEYVNAHPGNEYWQERLAAALIAEWKYSSVRVPEDWPWTEEDWQAELDNRRPETTF